MEFIDFKKTSPSPNTIKHWIEKTDIDKVLNTKGTTYRNLKLKELNLDDNAKFEWLCKEFLLIKRPVIEYKESVLVAFNKEEYQKVFLNIK